MNRVLLENRKTRTLLIERHKVSAEGDLIDYYVGEDIGMKDFEDKIFVECKKAKEEFYRSCYDLSIYENDADEYFLENPDDEAIVVSPQRDDEFCGSCDAVWNYDIEACKSCEFIKNYER